MYICIKAKKKKIQTFDLKKKGKRTVIFYVCVLKELLDLKGFPCILLTIKHFSLLVFTVGGVNEVVLFWNMIKQLQFPRKIDFCDLPDGSPVFSLRWRKALQSLRPQSVHGSASFSLGCCLHSSKVKLSKMFPDVDSTCDRCRLSLNPRVVLNCPLTGAQSSKRCQMFPWWFSRTLWSDLTGTGFVTLVALRSSAKLDSVAAGGVATSLNLRNWDARYLLPVTNANVASDTFDRIWKAFIEDLRSHI